MPVDYTPCGLVGSLWLASVILVGRYLHHHAPAYEAERQNRSKPSPRTVFWTMITGILLAVPAFGLVWLIEWLRFG